MNNIADADVSALFHTVVLFCNKVIRDANIYTFQLMDLPDPNVKKIVSTIDSVVLPILDNLVREYDFSPESGIKIANIRQYTLHLRAINLAIINDDYDLFNKSINLLNSEPMLV